MASLCLPSISPLASRSSSGGGGIARNNLDSMHIAVPRRHLPLVNSRVRMKPRFSEIQCLIFFPKASHTDPSERPPSYALSPGDPFSLCDAPPPFPCQVTDIVDLIRMAATLLHQETQPIITREVSEGRPPPLEALTFTRLAKLHHLIHSWPNDTLSAMDGIDAFRFSLDDGTLLCK